MNDFTRRGLIAGASVAAASALPAEAAAPPKDRQGPSIYRYRVGSFEVTALYDGVWEKAHDPGFFSNATIATQEIEAFMRTYNLHMAHPFEWKKGVRFYKRLKAKIAARQDLPLAA